MTFDVPPKYEKVMAYYDPNAATQTEDSSSTVLSELLNDWETLLDDLIVVRILYPDIHM